MLWELIFVAWDEISEDSLIYVDLKSAIYLNFDGSKELSY